MNKRIKIILLIITIIIIITIIGIIIKKEISINNTNKEEWSNEFYRTDKNEINYRENTTVNELKEKMEIEADSKLYEVTEEYDGRKTLNIKPDISYKVAFAGILKQNKPTFEEIDNIFKGNYPREHGIWVSDQSREVFINLINNQSNCKYKINDEGYLIIQEDSENNSENDKKIKSVINSNKKIIVDINSYDYEVDVVTGEIVEYPFEQLGDILDVIGNDKDKIIVLTSNSKKRISNEEVIKSFIDSII